MAQNRPRVLFLAHLLPYPLDGGAKIKSYYTLRALASVYDVTLLAFIRSEDERKELEHLAAYCAGGMRTVLIPRSKSKNVTDAAASLLTRRSFIVSRDNVPAMRTAVTESIQRQHIDAIHIDHLQMAQYVLPRKSGARIILDHHNIESIIIKRLAETTPSKWVRIYANQEWPKLEKYEIDICKQCDQVLTVTVEDAAILRALDTSLTNVTTIPIGVDGEYFCPVVRRPDSKTLLSIGTMYWQPNIDAMLWFYEFIYPLIKQQVPDVQLNIVGNKPSEKIRGLSQVDSSVSVTGFVEDTRPSAVDCAAFIVPLLSGSGMRVKILNALSMALPIVSTRLGAEGIGVTEGKNILIGNSPDTFAAACVKLLRDPALRTQLGDAGRELVETHYSWNAISRRLLDTYARVLTAPGKTRVKA